MARSNDINDPLKQLLLAMANERDCNLCKKQRVLSAFSLAINARVVKNLVLLFVVVFGITTMAGAADTDGCDMCAEK